MKKDYIEKVKYLVVCRELAKADKKIEKLTIENKMIKNELRKFKKQ
jgi:hypothetical protein